MEPMRAAELLIEKIKKDYRDDVSLVVIMGSTVFNDTHSRSDLDMYFVPKTKRGEALGFVCIIGGVGYDFWALPWERLERIAAHEERITSIVTDGQVLYYGDECDITRFNDLKRRALDTGDERKFLEKAQNKLSEAYRDYASLLTAPSLPEARYAAIGVVFAVTNAIALLNRTMIRRGRGKLKGEILAMPLVPEGFEKDYDTVFISSDTGLIRMACGALIESTDKLILSQTQEHRPFAEALKDFYEELINFYNKIYHAAEIGDAYTALFAGVEIRHEMEWAFEGTGVSQDALPNLLAAYSPDNLTAYAEAARTHQLKFEELLAEKGVPVRRFQDSSELEEFMRKI